LKDLESEKWPTGIIQRGLESVEELTRNIIRRGLLRKERSYWTMNLYTDGKGIALSDLGVF
jgi:hypothetical protein